MVVHLKTVGGWPVVEQTVSLRLGGVYLRQARTDANGTATLIFQSDMPVGTYTLEVVFNGARSLNLAGSSAAFQVEIVSTAVEIKIIPPLPGINFKLDRKSVV